MLNSLNAFSVILAQKKPICISSLSGLLVRWTLGLEWNVDMNIHQMIDEAKQRMSLEFFMKIMIAGCWSIWDQRNDDVFNANTSNVQRCISRFKATFTLTMHRAKPSLKEGVQSWIDTL
jgi:hypothetical protein